MAVAKVATTRQRQRRRRQQTMVPRRQVFIAVLLWYPFFLLSCSTCNTVKASESDGGIDCPGPDEAFVTSCSGPESPPVEVPSPSLSPEIQSSDDLVDEAVGESKESNNSHEAHNSVGNNDDSQQEFDSSGSRSGDTTTAQQLKLATKELISRHYDPLPRQGKCAIGTICGFAASRLSLGVANRLFRLAGATWVLSEMMHASGFCDEAKCMPEGARPWIGILRKAMVQLCTKVRIIARQIWDQDRIRELGQKDEMLTGGFAVGAFVGFIV